MSIPDAKVPSTISEQQLPGLGDCKPNTVYIHIVRTDAECKYTEFSEWPPGKMLWQDENGVIQDIPVPASGGGEPMIPTSWPKGVRLLQDFGLANTVTPATITGMSLDLPAGVWVLEYCAMHVDSNDQIGHGTRLFFGGPSCFSYTFGAHGNKGPTGNEALPNSLTFPQESAGVLGQGQYSEQISSGIGVRLGGSIIKTLIINDTPITVSLQTGQLSNMTNTTTTVKAGSFMFAMPLNAVATASVVPPELGGAGVANPAEATETVVGAFPRTIRLTGPTDLILPTSGTVARLQDIPPPAAAGVTMDQVNDAISSAIAALKADPQSLYAFIAATGLPVENAMIPPGNTIYTQTGLVIRGT